MTVPYTLITQESQQCNETLHLSFLFVQSFNDINFEGQLCFTVVATLVTPVYFQTGATHLTHKLQSTQLCEELSKVITPHTKVANIPK
jgi:hypothetical protein